MLDVIPDTIMREILANYLSTADLYNIDKAIVEYAAQEESVAGNNDVIISPPDAIEKFNNLVQFNGFTTIGDTHLNNEKILQWVSKKNLKVLSLSCVEKSYYQPPPETTPGSPDDFWVLLSNSETLDQHSTVSKLNLAKIRTIHYGSYFQNNQKFIEKLNLFTQFIEPSEVRKNVMTFKFEAHFGSLNQSTLALFVRTFQCFPSSTYLKLLTKDMESDSMVTVAQKLPKLRVLNLSHITIQGGNLKGIGNHCNEIKHLSLRYCESVQIADVTSLLGKLPNLQHVVLDGSFRELKDSGMEVLAENVGNRLLSLSTGYCDYATDASLLHLGSYCHSLRLVSLAGSHYTEKGMAHLLDGCGKQLKNFKVFLCPKLSLDLLPLVAQHAKGLNDLTIVNCKLITDQNEVVDQSSSVSNVPVYLALHNMIPELPLLRRLNVRYLQQDHEVARIRSMYPELKFNERDDFNRYFEAEQHNCCI